MLFNSIEFALFLPIVFILYWFVFNRNLRLQNLFVVASSYLFYGWWDWKFLILIALTTMLSYGSGLLISKFRLSGTPEGVPDKPLWFRNKALLVSVSNIIINLGILFYFKYCNFFIDSFAQMFTLFGKTLNYTSLSIILPVGISFYTFQALSYSIDVYKRKIEATKDVVSFFAFVSFFPQLVAGPIERSTQLLPQFFRKREFDSCQAQMGLRQIIWGLFKKIVIADSCAVYVNNIFSNYETMPGSVLLLGALYFSFQIYADFSGYSDIAIGTAKLFGINLMRNFNYPYFSRDIAEFWRRWHISLTTWFRDYLYIPLGGSWGGKWQTIRNTFIIFLVSGFWHGASWTFVAWGAFHALLFMPLLLTQNNRKYLDIVAQNRMLPSLKEFIQMLSTFTLAMVGWIFFRSETILDSVMYIRRIFTNFDAYGAFNKMLGNERYAIEIIPLVLILLIFEWFGRKQTTPLTSGRWLMFRVILVLLLILVFGNFADYQSFIYFAF